MTGPVEWEPTQYKPSEIHDLRGAKQGPKVGNCNSSQMLQRLLLAYITVRILPVA
jgi:hypothetical protein